MFSYLCCCSFSGRNRPQSQVQNPDGEINGLRKHASNLTQKVQDDVALVLDHAVEQLRRPRQPKNRRNSHGIFIQGLHQTKETTQILHT